MNLINSSGLPGKLMIVGDFPTKKEYAAGKSFDGSCSFLLQSLVGKQIKIQNVYKTHYVKVPIPGYSSPNKKIKRKAIQEALALENWDELLREEITAINPSCIVACGEIALNKLTGHKVIEKWRGSITGLLPHFNSPLINVVPIYSPRDIWEQSEYPAVMTSWDLSRAIQISSLNSRFQELTTLWICETPEQLNNWWNDRGSRAPFLTCDIETHFGFITCLGFSHDGKEGMSIPLLVGKQIDFFQKGELYRLIRKILGSNIPKVNQNVKYDMTVCEGFGINWNNVIGDTMLMAHTIYPEYPVGLDFLTSVYVDTHYYKDEGKKFNPKEHDVSRLLLYNAKDAVYTHRIWTAQQQDAESSGVKHFFFNKVWPTFWIFKRMDERGIRIDESKRQSLRDKYYPQLDKIQTTVSLLAEKHINLNSPKQVGEFVYDILQCPKQTHLTPGGNVAYNTDEDTLEDIYLNKVTDSGRKKILKDVILGKKLLKVMQFLNAHISPDSRMRTSYKIQGTETGRTSAGKSIEQFYVIENGKIIDEECGGSFQTIPKHGYEFGTERIGADLREIFVPSPGYCFIESDLAQAEDRVVCVLAEDNEGLELLNKKDFKRNKYGLKDDRHTLTAMLITGKEFDFITEDDRQIRGKKPRHAGNYDIGANTLSIFTHIPRSECVKILNIFHSTNPKIRGIFHAQIRKWIEEQRFLISPHGRRRDFFGRVDESMFKGAYSTIPQATVTDHNKQTILPEIVKIFPEPYVFPLSESHDSLTCEVLLDLKDKYIETVLKVTETPIDFKLCSLSRDYQLVIPGEVQWSSENWGQMEKVRV